jgi:SAM-dependent methyltransferase
MSITPTRDFNSELKDNAERSYAYNFDVDVMHRYMIESFKPFLRPGTMFETVQLPQQYDHVVMTHVLEHLDDPVAVLRRVNREWLAPHGRFFLVCPNANAPSRQIAVKMGLISHNAAVTKAEALHGHRCTYSLDTLERDAVAAGLKVMHRSGIFFKALANFQWDQLLKTDIVSQAYLDGCYQLGHQYPDLCASIFLVCERGEP